MLRSIYFRNSFWKAASFVSHGFNLVPYFFFNKFSYDENDAYHKFYLIRHIVLVGCKDYLRLKIRYLFNCLECKNSFNQ